jgi:hypothetical protein
MSIGCLFSTTLPLGSARVPEDHPHFIAAQDLASSVAVALNCTTWSGLGAGRCRLTLGRTQVDPRVTPD